MHAKHRYALRPPRPSRPHFVLAVYHRERFRRCVRCVAAAGSALGGDGGDGEAGYFSEFLSARISRHPIFTDMKFWQHVLKEAVQAKADKVKELIYFTPTRQECNPSTPTPLLICSANIFICYISVCACNAYMSRPDKPNTIFTTFAAPSTSSRPLA